MIETCPADLALKLKRFWSHFVVAVGQREMTLAPLDKELGELQGDSMQNGCERFFGVHEAGKLKASSL
jgi:hypothetical protein